MKILHLTTILPAPVIRKKNENDIIYRIISKYREVYPNDKHRLILCLPYSNFLLSTFKTKWKEYYRLFNKGYYNYEGEKIYLLKVPGFKNDQKFWPLFGRVSYFLNFNLIHEVIGEFKPDLIHVHDLRKLLYLTESISQKYSIQYVATARGMNDKVIDRIEKFKSKPEKIHSVNQQVISTYKEKLEIDFRMIPHPVGKDFFKLPLNYTKTNRFVSMGRLLSLKNYDKVIQALSEIDIDYEYHIYGEGPAKNDLERIIEEKKLNGKVFIKDRVSYSQVKNVLVKYDMLIQPSYPETLGRIYLEALAVGLPVIASKNTGVDGILTNGKEGYLVNHKNIEELKTAIYNFDQMYDEEYRTMKKESRKLAEKFSWKRALQSYYSFYHD